MHGTSHRLPTAASPRRLAAGVQALGRGQPVLVLEPAGASTPDNRILRDRGALAVRSRRELEDRLQELPASPAAQLTLL